MKVRPSVVAAVDLPIFIASFAIAMFFAAWNTGVHVDLALASSGGVGLIWSPGDAKADTLWTS